MTVTKPKRRRNRLVTVLLLPAVALMWLVGWGLVCIGRMRDEKPKTRAKRRDANVTMVPAVAVEEEPLEASAA